MGAITLVNTDSRRHFDDDDLAFAELLASRAAVAIENARLYRDLQSLNADLEKRVEQRTYELSEAYNAAERGGRGAHPRRRNDARAPPYQQ